jgi:hypothetical protein
MPRSFVFHLEQEAMREIERRDMKAREFRAVEENGATKIVGYAAVFNAWSEDLGGFRESIKPGAFANALKDSDTRALINHDPNHVLGRTKSGTLTLREDEVGLWYEVALPDTQDARDLITKIKRGDIDGNSFAFTVALDDWAWSDDTIRRVIEEVDQLYDVGPVTYPAYPQTSASVRSRISELQRTAPNGQAADRAAALDAERQARFELRRRRLALSLSL